MVFMPYAVKCDRFLLTITHLVVGTDIADLGYAVLKVQVKVQVKEVMQILKT